MIIVRNSIGFCFVTNSDVSSSSRNSISGSGNIVFDIGIFSYIGTRILNRILNWCSNTRGIFNRCSTID